MSQHKKSRLYYVTLKEDFFKSHPFDIIRGMPNGREAIYLYLELLTESIHHNGELRFSQSAAFTDAILSGKFYTPVEIISPAMNLLEQMELISKKEDGTIVVKEFEKYLGSRTYETIEKNTKKMSQQIFGVAQGTKNSSFEAQKDEQGTNSATIIKILDTRDKILDISPSGESSAPAHAYAHTREIADSPIKPYPTDFADITSYLKTRNALPSDTSELYLRFLDISNGGWLDSKHHPIKDWQSYVLKLANKCNNNDATKVKEVA